MDLVLLGWLDNLTLGGRYDLEREWTNDSNDELHEYVGTDVLLTLTHSRLAAIGDLVNFGGFGRAYLPVSEASRLAGLLFGVRLGGEASVDLAPVKITGRAYAQKNFHEYTTSGLEEPGASSEYGSGSKPRALATPRDVRDLAFADLPPEMTGGTNQLTSWYSIWALDLEVRPVASLSVFATWTLLNGHGYDAQPFSCAEHRGVVLPCVEPSGEDLAHGADLDTSHERFSQLFQAGIEYSFMEKFTVGFSYVNWPLPQRTNGSDFKYPWLFYQHGTNWTTVGVDLTVAL